MNQTNSPRRLTRSRDDRFVGGVAAGIARYFNVDPVLVRAAFVISVAFGGIGVLAYLILLVMVPIEGNPDEPAAPPTGSKRFWVIVGTVVLGCLALASIDGGGLGGWFFGIGPGPLFGITIWILALGGVFWLVREATRDDNAETGAFGRGPRPSQPVAPAPVPPSGEDETAVLPGDGEDDHETAVLPDESDEAPTAVTTTMAASPSQTAPITPPLTPAGTAAQRNPRDDGPSTIGRIMTWFAIGFSALIILSILVVVSAGVTALFGAIPMASVVILLGVGLVVAALKDRRQVAAWGLAAALAIALPMAAISIADLRIEGNFGDITEEPRLAGDIPSEGYKLGAGAMTVDLRKYPFEKGETLDLKVRSGMGLSRVIVPDGVCVSGRVQGKAGLGDVRGVEFSGVGLDRTFSAGRGDAPGLNLDTEFKLGYFDVVDNTDWKKYGPYDAKDSPWEGDWENRMDSPRSQSAARERALAACMPAMEKKRSKDFSAGRGSKQG